MQASRAMSGATSQALDIRQTLAYYRLAAGLLAAAAATSGIYQLLRLLLFQH
jgi:hypothetical protein